MENRSRAGLLQLDWSLCCLRIDAAVPVYSLDSFATFCLAGVTITFLTNLRADTRATPCDPDQSVLDAIHIGHLITERQYIRFMSQQHLT